MWKLKKYFKPFLVSIIVVIGFLFVQAQADLALPGYLQQIVDNGISGSGIDSAIPNAIGKEDFDHMQLFMEDSEIATFNQSYELVEKGNATSSQLKTYTKANDMDMYVLKELSEDEEATLQSAISYPLALTSLFNNPDNDYLKDNPEFQGMLASLPEGMSIFDVLETLPREQVLEIRSSFSSLGEMGESIVEGMGKTAVRGLYENLGVNMQNYQTSYILKAGVLMLGMTIIVGLCSSIVGFFSARIGAGFARDVRKALFDKVNRLSVAEYETFSTATLITRTTNDITQVQQIITMVLRMVIYAPIIGAGAFMKVMNSETGLTWIVGVILVVLTLILGIIFGFAVPLFRKNQKLVDKLNSSVREVLTGLLVIRAFDGQEYEEEKVNQVNQALYKLNLKLGRIMNILMPAMSFVLSSSSIIIIYFGAQGIDAGSMQIGDILAFMQYCMQIVMAYLMIAMLGMFLPRAGVSARRISEVLNTLDSVLDPETGTQGNPELKGVVTFDHVSFRYPGAEEDVLKDITFTANPGETTAFIGSTGSGKSTIINLVPRLFDATQGSVRLDGADVKDYIQADLHEKIGFVPQKGMLFTGTIADNIRYGKLDATEEEVKEAARLAQALPFIEEKEEGFDSPIAQGGTNVSGGQRQRLSIARAVVRKPEILIFDDSFSALDMKTDAELRKALAELTAKYNTTTLVVAQRISSIMKAEQIVVLDEGKIVGKGTHNELMKSCEVYQEIAYSQLSKEELDHE